MYIYIYRYVTAEIRNYTWAEETEREQTEQSTGQIDARQARLDTPLQKYTKQNQHDFKISLFM